MPQPPDYGSPKAGDGTSRLEGATNRAAARLARIRKRIVGDLLPRPPGTVIKKVEDELFDYQQIKDNPQAMAQVISEKAAAPGTDGIAIGQEGAEIEFATFVARMEKLDGSAISK